MTSSLLAQEQQNYDLNTEFSRINTALEYLKKSLSDGIKHLSSALFSDQVTKQSPDHIHTETLLIVL